jgi:hypothetical protein
MYQIKIVYTNGRNTKPEMATFINSKFNYEAAKIIDGNIDVLVNDEDVGALERALYDLEYRFYYDEIKRI